MKHIQMTERSKTTTMPETTAFRRPSRFGLATLSTRTAAAGALALLLGGGFSALAAGNDNRAPEVPYAIAVPGTTNKVHCHAFAIGFQVYTWNGTDWGRAVPEATLFHGNGVVATHFAGPTWESNSGSIVVGAVVQPVTVDLDAIPWVLLRAVISEGPGIFADITYIQRVNTTGGKAPFENGAFVGQVARVPYTADYFFYRSTSH
jgi:hypothetical protein